MDFYSISQEIVRESLFSTIETIFMIEAILETENVFNYINLCPLERFFNFISRIRRKCIFMTITTIHSEDLFESFSLIPFQVHTECKVQLIIYLKILGSIATILIFVCTVILISLLIKVALKNNR